MEDWVGLVIGRDMLAMMLLLLLRVHVGCGCGKWHEVA